MADAHILLVEDDRDDGELTLRAMEGEGMRDRVIVVRDRAEAPDLLFMAGAHANRRPITRPAVVMLDLMLQKMSGLDVLKRLREDPRSRLMPVVVLTSSDEERDVIESHKLGANSYVRKPVAFSESCKAVAELGPYWLIRNVTPP